MVAKSIRSFQRGVQLAHSNVCLGKWLCLEFRSSPGENLAFVSSQISRIAEEVLTFSFSGRYIHVQFHVVCCKKERCIVRALIRQFYPPRSIHCFYVFFRQSKIPFTFFLFSFFLSFDSSALVLYGSFCYLHRLDLFAGCRWNSLS